MSYKSAYDIVEAFGYLTNGEVGALKKLVGLLPENPTVVNIGAGAGTSGVAIREERDDLKLITIDISKGGPLGGLQNELNAFDLRGIVGNRRQILGDSKEVAKSFTLKVDMVFIDGNHTYEGCAGDINGWLPHIKIGGIIAVHDYVPASHGIWPYVRQAVDELLRPKFNEIIYVDSVVAFEVS